MDRKTIRILNIMIVLSVAIFIGTTLLSIINIYQIASTIHISDAQQNTKGNKLYLSATFEASNPGVFPAEASFTADYSDSFGNKLNTSPLQILIPSGKIDYTQPINLEIDLSNLKQENVLKVAQDYGNITLRSSISSSLGNILIINADLGVSLPWSPPVHGLQVNSPQIVGFNSSYLVIKSEYSFENLSPFLDASGPVDIKVFDKDNKFVGKGNVNVVARPNTNSSGELYVEVKLPFDTDYMLFNDAKMNYRAVGVLSAESIGSSLLNVTWPFDVDWGAPVKDPILTDRTFTPYNATHSIYTAKLIATNSNGYITLKGRIRAIAINGTRTISYSEYQPYMAQPKTSNSWDFRILVPNETLTLTNATLLVEIQTDYKDFTWEASLNG
jgi:hypothetical protein